MRGLSLETVAGSCPFAIHDLLINYIFPTHLPRAFVGDLLSPENTKYLPLGAVDENLNVVRGLKKDLGYCYRDKSLFYKISRRAACKTSELVN